MLFTSLWRTYRREAAALLEIEKERAKQRQAENARTNQPQAKSKGQKREPVPPSGKSKARDNVGKKIGTSGKTAERAVFW